jgi:BsuBI/PstI restriction endonuclease domain/BsuBI/PstI restriction endonuclease HTH domain
VRQLISIDECMARLAMVFPREAFDPALANRLAATAVAAMLYVDAVAEEGEDAESVRWVRPSTCLWLSEEAYRRVDEDSREAYYRAALRSKEAVEKLHRSWGFAHHAPYKDNTREPLRDETLSGWLGYGVVRARPGVAATSPRPRWALESHFADLFDPQLEGKRLADAIECWREVHLSPAARLRAQIARQREDRFHAVEVELPTGERRELEPGPASLIIKGIVEVWAPMRLADPVVVTISEPGKKIYTADGERLAGLGIEIDQTALLPDAVLADLGGGTTTFWIVEAVASDGPITEDRKRSLEAWALEQRIPVETCRFLSAFISRNDQAARRRLKDLAAGTFAWYADEPTFELAWYELDGGESDSDHANVVPLRPT